MSDHDATTDESADDPTAMEVTGAREAMVGSTPVRRVLPMRSRRTVGAWCFVDHLGPAPVDGDGIGPHPHIGLHTVTWLREGEVLHKDSLGSEQLIRPGQLNVMTAGQGIAHAEETPTKGGTQHGVQLWVAQPEATRWGAPDFAHHAELPQVELAAGTASVLVGTVDGATSPARADTPLMGAELSLRAGSASLALDPTFEHAIVVLEGSVRSFGTALIPGQLGFLAPGNDELTLEATDDAVVLLLGGEPFEAQPLMWWNYVGRTWDEIWDAHDAWQAGPNSDRFDPVGSDLARIPSPPPKAKRSS